MLEEQGKTVLVDFIKKALRFLGKHSINIGRNAEQKLIKNISETGQKSVKSLVKMGGDLELSEEIKSKDQLKVICRECRKQGLAFGIRKTADGNHQILYQRKHSAVLSDIMHNTIAKELTPKPKLSDVLNKVSKIKQRQTDNIKQPIRHKEVEAR